MLAEHGIHLASIEIKVSATASTTLVQGLQRWSALAGAAAERAVMLYGGAERRKLSGIDIVPWAAVDEVASRI